MKEKAIPLCEFCGEPTWQTADDQMWRVLSKKGVLHTFCSLLCALRFFGLGRHK